MIKKLTHFISGLTLLLFAGSVFGQYDDLYYNPKTDLDSRSYKVNDYTDDSYDSYDAYDDEYYDYDYYYSSRIRRFYRPSVAFGFYSPFYVDLGYYDPFYSSLYNPGGINIYIGIGSLSYSRWRSSSWYSPWSWSYYRSNYYRPWSSWGYYDPFYSGFGYSSWRNYGCPPSWGYSGVSVYNTNIVNVNQVNQVGTNRGTYYGPRTMGLVVSNVSSPRNIAYSNTGRTGLSTVRQAPTVIERRNPRGSTPGVSRDNVPRTTTPRTTLDRIRSTDIDRGSGRSSIGTQKSTPRTKSPRSSIYDRTQSIRRTNPSTGKSKSGINPNTYKPSRNSGINSGSSRTKSNNVFSPRSGSSINRGSTGTRTLPSTGPTRSTSPPTKSGGPTSPRKKGN